MMRTLQVRLDLVTARNRSPPERQFCGTDVLHCDKKSWFRHIEVPTVRFVVPALIVSGDNGLSACGKIRGMMSYRCKAHTSEGLRDGCRWIDKEER
jgi:hypothetical protein